MLSSRDNWERLVAAVLKREQFWQLCFQHSRTPGVSTVSSDSTSDFTQEILNLSGYSFSLELPNSVAPRSPFPLENPSVSQVSNKASPQPITRKLFSALYRRRKPKGKHLADISEAVPIHLGRVRRFSIHELRAATDNFSNKIGPGQGDGITYKGRLADGSLVAVKRYNSGLGSKNGSQTELEINSIAVHRNVLHVLGICITPKEQMLIYPLMVNGSVESRIRDRQESLPPLDWPTRKQIALGTARGLAYMHHECHVKIIHRDVKAVNILLDEDFEAVIAHFNLAKLMDFNDTDVLTAVRGTLGHIAPEYLSTGKCSEKTDVFGYGVFLLELITGQRAFDLARLDNEDDAMLRYWVKKNYKERKLEMMVDADCGGNYMEELVEQLIQMALFCTVSAPEKRPKMSEVVRMLEVDDVSVIEQYKEEMFPQEIQKHWNEEEMVDEAVLTASYMFDDDIPIFPR